MKIQLKPIPGVDMRQLAERLRRQRTTRHFPRTAAAVHEITKEAQKLFLRAIQGKPMSWSGGTFTIFRVTGRLVGYVLAGLRYPFRGNPLRGAIDVKAPHWQYVRNGVRVHDMKPYLLRSAKAKYTKDGRRYVLVPIPIDPTHRFSARVIRACVEGSKGWIYGASRFRQEPYRGLTPRRVDLAVQEWIRPLAQRMIQRAVVRDLKGQ